MSRAAPARSTHPRSCHFHNPAQNYDFADALISGKTHFYRCEIQSSPTAEATTMIDMCKTLGGP